MEFKKQNKQRVRGRKETQTEAQTLNCREKQKVIRGEVNGGWVKEVMECTSLDECWVIHGIAESLYCTPETNVTLYVNYAEIQI